ncbi:hypothetical protein BS78_K019800 [Paspalum vaginatum]|uniref:Replication protein A OB domain-containing protein n=1 Tax=Paspalum vaginatum TaxID=158149 RepID=A0A9W7XD62_9POAL|nr:hypothetical protein BS78_K019800 [Paspalum vaginatum]
MASVVIRVRVYRKWEYCGRTGDGELVHVDLVLIDEKGNAMYAEIPTKDAKEKSPLVQEGSIYIISRFLPGNYMIEFNFYTEVQPVPEDAVIMPELVYHLTPFSQLECHAGDQSRFIDVVGVLVEISDAKTMHLTNSAAPVISRDIVLRDLTHFEIKVTLWGDRASSFDIDAIYDPNESEPIVVLLVGTVVKTYIGQHYLSGNATCRWYFNPTIPEAVPFYNRRTAPSVDQARGARLAQAEIATLTDLATMDPYTIGWFASCAKCNKSCVVEGSGYKCRLCLSTNSKFKFVLNLCAFHYVCPCAIMIIAHLFYIFHPYRYKLSFVATDGTTEAKMIAFADVATRIIGKPVQTLMRARTPIQDFPSDITALVTMKFTFVVMQTDESFDRPEKSYRVLSMLSAHGRQAPERF